MGKTYIRLSASVQNADAIVNAIMFIKNMRVYEVRPIDALFKKFPKNEEGETIGTYAEASRIIDYLEEDRTIIQDGKQFKWHGETKIWDDRDARRKYVLEMLEHADDTRIKVIRKNNEALPPALVAYNNKRKKQEAVINVQEAAIVPEQPVAVNYAGRPVQPEQLTDEEIELGIKEYSLSLQLLQQEKEKRDALKAKKAELFKVFSEMAKDEGFSIEDIVGMI